MLGALRVRDFRLLWAGQLLSTFGDWLLVIAVPLYVFEVTGSVATTGLLYAAQNIPAVVVGPLAGVFADRWDRRRTMATVDALGAVLMGSVAVVVALSSAAVWVVMAAVVVERVLAQFYAPASTALVPGLVGTGSDLVEANSAFASSAALVRIAGAPVGGALYAMVGIEPLLVLDALTFGIAFGCVLAIRHRARPESVERERGVLSDFQEGLSTIRTQAPLRWVVAAMAAFMLCNGAVSGLLVPYVNEQLAAGPVVFGTILSALGVGFLAGAVLAAPLGKRDPLHPVIAGSLAVVAAGFALMFATGSSMIALAGAFIAGTGGSVTLVIATTTLQRSTDNHILGRVTGVSNSIQQTAQVLGAVIAVALVAPLGLKESLLAWSALLAVFAAIAGLNRPTEVKSSGPPDSRKRADPRTAARAGFTPTGGRRSNADSCETLARSSSTNANSWLLGPDPSQLRHGAGPGRRRNPWNPRGRRAR